MNLNDLAQLKFEPINDPLAQHFQAMVNVLVDFFGAKRGLSERKTSVIAEASHYLALYQVIYDCWDILKNAKAAWNAPFPEQPGEALILAITLDFYIATGQQSIYSFSQWIAETMKGRQSSSHNKKRAKEALKTLASFPVPKRRALHHYTTPIEPG